MYTIRLCEEHERSTVLKIVNTAAMKFRDVIPADRWHDPYMQADELDAEIAAGVEMWGYERDGELLGVMGMQRVRDVDLIRHAYVRPDQQRSGVGAALLQHMKQRSLDPMLVGTWAAAHWAVSFYMRHGFTPVPTALIQPLLSSYWSIPQRQIETSVVLATRIPRT